jgi:hypothetical protein
MKLIYSLLILGLSSYTLVTGATPYFSLSNQNIYALVEYELLKNSNGNNLFVINQPFKIDQIESLFMSSAPKYTYYVMHAYNSDAEEEQLNIRLTPSINRYSDGNDSDNFAALALDGSFHISNAIFVNEIDLNQRFKFDEKFHGDDGEWLMGYFKSSYALYENNGLELFAGRVSRNFGTLNDYSLLFSSNPYSFDHYGFSVMGKRLKYSFYTTRLNDSEGIDLQGVLIPVDSISTAKRFWAVQRLDFKINERLQIAFSEATIYGGPDQQFVASYLNPVHFFYAAQRNQGVQLNSFWQINAFCQPATGVGLYLDLFADDLIVNNTPGVDDRAVHPDRLGLMVKGSYASAENSLISLRYVRIWNETYTSYRTFENYTYFNMGIGYPENSFEGLNFSIDYFNRLPLFIHGGLEVWRKGDRDLSSAFHDELNDFPVGPVSKGVNCSLRVSYLWSGGYKLILDVNQNYLPGHWNEGLGSESDYEILLTAQYYFKITL